MISLCNIASCDIKHMCYNWVQMNDKSIGGVKMEQSNNARFNKILNSCVRPRDIYGALLALAKPSVQQADDVGQKRQIIIGEILAFLDETQVDQ